MPQMTARQRRQMLHWHQAHGGDIPATCAQFGVSRATLYRWLGRDAADPQQPLRAQSRRPHTSRGPAWSPDEVLRLCDLTMQHPTWGRGRLTVALAAQTAARRAPATVGRVLAKIRARCPICRGREGRHDPGAHALHTDFMQLGVAKPLRLLPSDPEKAELLREAQALLRRR